MLGLNTVFEVETKDGILIIVPRGDSTSFSAEVVQKQTQLLLQKMEADRQFKVIVDFSQGDYFGSLVLSSVNEFGEQAQRYGGQLVMCHASDDMRAMIEHLKMQDKYPCFPTRKHALKVLKAWILQAAS